jgi:hypothetical protein
MPFSISGVDQESLLVRWPGLAAARGIPTTAQDVIHRADQNGSGVQKDIQEGVAVFLEDMKGWVGT